MGLPGAFSGAGARGSSFTNTHSIAFGGTDEYITIGQPTEVAAYDSDLTTLTISLWFKTSSASSTNTLYSVATTATPSNFRIFTTTSGVIRNIIGGTTIDAGSGYADGAWHHYVISIRDASTFEAWVDGSSVATGNPGGSAAPSSIDFIIGGRRGANNTDITQCFVGSMNQLTIWDTGFVTADVTALRTSSKPNDPRNHSKAANLKHWLPLGTGDTFSTCTNRINASYNGTMTNMESGDITADVP